MHQPFDDPPFTEERRKVRKAIEELNLEYGWYTNHHYKRIAKVSGVAEEVLYDENLKAGLLTDMVQDKLICRKDETFFYLPTYLMP